MWRLMRKAKRDGSSQAVADVCSRSPRARRAGRNKRLGASAVEFALVAPVVFLLVFGMIEWGRLVMIRQALTNASRDACREAALVTTGSKEKAEAVVRDYLRGVVPRLADSDKLAISVNPAGLNGIASGSLITVEVSLSCADASWVPASFLHSENVILRGRSTQRRE